MQINFNDLFIPILELENSIFIYFKTKEEHNLSVHFGQSLVKTTLGKKHAIIYEGYLFKKPKSLIPKCLESNERKLNSIADPLFSVQRLHTNFKYGRVYSSIPILPPESFLLAH